MIRLRPASATGACRTPRYSSRSSRTYRPKRSFGARRFARSDRSRSHLDGWTPLGLSLASTDRITRRARATQRASNVRRTEERHAHTSLESLSWHRAGGAGARDRGGSPRAGGREEVQYPRHHGRRHRVVQSQHLPSRHHGVRNAEHRSHRQARDNRRSASPARGCGRGIGLFFTFGASDGDAENVIRPAFGSTRTQPAHTLEKSTSVREAPASVAELSER